MGSAAYPVPWSRFFWFRPAGTKRCRLPPPRRHRRLLLRPRSRSRSRSRSRPPLLRASWSPRPPRTRSPGPWNAVEGATAYAVQISMDEIFGDDDVTTIALTPTHTVSDLPPSTLIYLRVAAGVGTSLEDALLSDWSTHVTGMTAMPPPPPEPPEPPAVPTGLQVSSSGDDFIEWSWDAVEGADGYDVQFSPDEMFDPGDEIIPRTAGQTSYRREPLPAGSSAFLRVRSRAGAGEDRLESEWSPMRPARRRRPRLRLLRRFRRASKFLTAVKTSSSGPGMRSKEPMGTKSSSVWTRCSIPGTRSSPGQPARPPTGGSRCLLEAVLSSGCGPAAEPEMTGWRASGPRMPPA